MDVVIAGGSGFIGSALGRSLRGRRPPGDPPGPPGLGAGGRRHRGVGPARSPGSTPRASTASTRSSTSPGWASATRKWSDARKDEILQSRLSVTGLLSSAVARLSRPPAVFVSASAVGLLRQSGRRGVHRGQRSRRRLPRRRLRGLGGRRPPGRGGRHPGGLDPHRPRARPVGRGAAAAAAPVQARARRPPRQGDAVHVVDHAGRRGGRDPQGHRRPVARWARSTSPRRTRSPTRSSPRRWARCSAVRPRSPHRCSRSSCATAASSCSTCLLDGQRVLPTKLAAAGYAYGHTELEPALRALLGKDVTRTTRARRAMRPTPRTCTWDASEWGDRGVSNPRPPGPQPGALAN